MLSTLPNRMSAMWSDPFASLTQDFFSTLSGNGSQPATAARQIAPLSLWEDGQAVYIDVEVPGVSLSDLDVSLENGRLTIRGERKQAECKSEFVHDERFWGQFERTVTLHEWVDSGSIEATLQDGVLHLKLSKRPEAQRQRIAINYGGSDAKCLDSSS